MYLIADTHIGAYKRNRFLYTKVLDALEEVVKDIISKSSTDHIMNLGDLWDNVNPSPKEYVFVQDILTEFYANSSGKFYGIPGNHDMVQESGICAWDVCVTDLTTSITEPSDTIINDNVLVVPYFVGMLDYIKEYNGSAKVLLSHFSTKEMHAFAGIVNEDDPMFDKFDLIITGDTHNNYSKGKWHSCGSTYFTKIDEMVSKTNIPCIMYFDENAKDPASTVKRITFPHLKPSIILDESDAVDDNTVYVIMGNKIATKPNILYKPIQEVKEELVMENIEPITINNAVVTLDTLIDASYPDIPENEKKSLKMFCNRTIDIDGLLGLYKSVEDEILGIEQTNIDETDILSLL